MWNGMARLNRMCFFTGFLFHTYTWVHAECVWGRMGWQRPTGFLVLQDLFSAHTHECRVCMRRNGMKRSTTWRHTGCPVLQSILSQMSPAITDWFGEPFHSHLYASLGKRIKYREKHARSAWRALEMLRTGLSIFHRAASSSLHMLSRMTVFLPVYARCIHICIYMYTYIYTHIYICIHIYICVYIYVYTYHDIYIYIYVYIYTYVYLYIQMYICIHVYMYVCIFVYIFIYTHIYI